MLKLLVFFSLTINSLFGVILVDLNELIPMLNEVLESR